MENQGEPQSSLSRQELLRDYLTPALWWKRLLNMLIDLAFFYVSILGIGLLLGILLVFAGVNVEEWEESITENPILDRVITSLFFVLYYCLFEYFFGKSFGKILTKTRVLMEDGSKPPFKNLVGRSFARLIPFNVFSFLSEYPRGWHDSMSGTMVIDDSSIPNSWFDERYENEEENL
ncbi:MAG: RDD family protein [Verrucomicrobia bacterium]|nr:RDD family protein [Cytophagales bacterium]